MNRQSPRDLSQGASPPSSAALGTPRRDGPHVLPAHDSPQLTDKYFFSDSGFSHHTVLLAWEHEHVLPLTQALLAQYFPAGKAPAVSKWPNDDYGSIWTVTLDATGDLTVSNALCEGIDSAKPPATAPQP